MQKYGLLFAIGLMALIINIDYTAVNLALAPVARDFHLGVHDVDWLLSGYILAWAALVIPAGKAVDIYGPRRLCLLGLSLFLISSLLAGYAVNETMLVISRVLQGIAGGLYVPALYGLVSTYFAVEKRGRAMGVLSLGAGFGLGFGPTFGGMIIHLLDWRWIFFVNVPIALIALLILWRTPEKIVITESTKTIPKLASVFLSLAVVEITFALDQGIQRGVYSPVFLGTMMGAILMFICFVYRQRYSQTPWIAWRLFQNKSYVGVLTAFVLEQYSFAAIVVTVGLFLQKVMGVSSFEAGIIFLALTLAFGIAAPIVGRLTDTHGVKIFAVSGMLILALSTFAFVVAASHSSSLSKIVMILMVMGIGMGIAFSSLNTGITVTVAQNDVGMASGIFLMIALIANALGVFASTKLYEAMSYDYLIHHLNSSIVSLFTPKQIEKIQHSIAYFDSALSNISTWLNLPNDVFSHAMSAGIEASMLLSGVVTLVGAGIAAALIGKNKMRSEFFQIQKEADSNK